MKFRTEIGPLKGGFEISHNDRIVMLGSCFADNIGMLLGRDGFKVVHNPLGPLFNPSSIARVFQRENRPYGEDDFVEHEGVWHCLNFANRYQASSPEELAEKVNNDFIPLVEAIENADTLILTFGTSKVYNFNGITVGNCHKLPGTMFSEHSLTVDEICSTGWIPEGKRIILTLSPVRYLGEGLPKGFLSKATLRVAIDNICRQNGFDYFPAFEIVNDDLRDYRFYGSDMRHPSEVAVDYIYEKFAEAYFSELTKQKSLEYRKAALRAAHRPIIS